MDLSFALVGVILLLFAVTSQPFGGPYDERTRRMLVRLSSVMGFIFVFTWVIDIAFSD